MAKYREGQVVMGSDKKTPYKMTGGQWVPLREPPQSEPGFQAGEMLGNVIPSGKQFLGNVWDAVSHPVDTGKAIAQTSIGASQKIGGAIDSALGFLPGPMEKAIGFPLRLAGMAGDAAGVDGRPQAEAVGDFYKNRYGSVDQALNTVETDPVGALADAATFLPGKASAALNPLSLAKSTVKGAAKAAIPKGLPASMYESAAKFGTTISKEDRAAMVKTALRNQLNLTASGAEKLEGLIDKHNASIAALIDKAEKAGTTVPVKDVYRHIAVLKARMGGAKVNAGADLSAIDNIVAGFDDHMYLNRGQTTMSPAELQDFKVDLYKHINFDAKNQTGTMAKQETYKTLARGAKDSLEQIDPGIGAANRELGPLYELQEPHSRAVARIQNRNMVPLTAPLEVGLGSNLGNMMGGPAAGVVGGTAGALVAALGLPAVKGATAIKLQKIVDSGWVDTFIKHNPSISRAELAAALMERVKDTDSQATTE